MVVNMRFIPWRPLISEKLPFRTNILNEMTIAIKRLERGVKLSYMIYGPLGIGKTSLLLSLKKILEPLSAIVPIYLNPTWNFLTFTDLKDILLDTLSKVKTKVEIKEFNTLLTYIDEGRLGLAFELLDKLLIDNGLYAVLMIDDVSTITRMSRYSDLKITPYSLFETILDRDNICLIVSDTTRALINKVLRSRISDLISRPLSPLKEKEELSLLVEFSDDKLSLNDEVAHKIHQLTRGIPLYDHILGLELLRYGIKEPSFNDIEVVIEKSIEEPDGLFNFQMRMLHLKYILKIGGGFPLKIVLEIIRGNNSVSEIARRTGKSYQYIAMYAKRLREAGFPLQQEDGELKIVDRIYLMWLRLVFEKCWYF